MWNDRFHNFIIKLGFCRSSEDSCLYQRLPSKGKFYLLLYVDDLLLISDDLYEINAVKKLLSKEFEMVDLNEVKCFLGLNIERDIPNGIMRLNQKQYLINVLRKFEMLDCKEALTPMEAGLKLKKGERINSLRSRFVN